MSAQLRSERVVRAKAIIGALSELWPGTFTVHGRHRRPLALGIHTALLVAVEPAIMAGTITVTDIKRALARYARSDGYLHACRRAGTARIDLTGTSSGMVTPAEAQYARALIEKRRRRRQAAKAVPVTQTAPQRMGPSGRIRRRVHQREQEVNQ